MNDADFIHDNPAAALEQRTLAYGDFPLRALRRLHDHVGETLSDVCEMEGVTRLRQGRERRGFLP